jgi:hypothetical protein
MQVMQNLLLLFSFIFLFSHLERPIFFNQELQSYLDCVVNNAHIVSYELLKWVQEYGVSVWLQIFIRGEPVTAKKWIFYSSMLQIYLLVRLY